MAQARSIARRPLSVYALWLAGIIATACIAVAWYRYVEEIGWRELASRIRETKIDDGARNEHDI